MLVINRIGPAKVKKVVLGPDVVEIYLVTGEILLYRRAKSESLQEIQI